MNFIAIFLSLASISASASPDLVIEYLENGKDQLTIGDGLKLVPVEETEKKEVDSRPEITRAIYQAVKRSMAPKKVTGIAAGGFECSDCSDGPFVAGGFGMGAAVRGGFQNMRGITASGMVIASGDAIQNGEDYNPWGSMSAELNFNTAMFGDMRGGVGTSIGLAIHPSVLKSFLDADENGFDFLVGASGRAQVQADLTSKEHIYFSGAFMPETGFLMRGDNATLAVTGSVSFGGESCVVTLPNAENFQFLTRGTGFGGVLRLSVNNRLAVNAIYAYYPKDVADKTVNLKSKELLGVDADGNPKSADLQRSTGGEFIRIIALLNVSDKLSFSGSCTINQFSTTTFGDVNRTFTMQRSAVQLGVIRRIVGN